MAARVLGQVNLNVKIVTADALHTVTATAEFSCGQGCPGRASMRCRPSTRLAVRPRISALDAACSGRAADQLARDPQVQAVDTGTEVFR